MEKQRKRKILVVDDEFEVRKMVIEFLRIYDSSLEIDEAKSARCALDEFLNRKKYDVIITDFDMPGMSGVELIAEFYQIKPKQKYILFSGSLEADIFNLLDVLEVKPALVFCGKGYGPMPIISVLEQIFNKPIRNE